MRSILKRFSTDTEKIWEEESGFLGFLTRLPKEVERFNATFGFRLKSVSNPPERIDNDADIVRSVGFVVVRENRLMPERQYCLYGVLKDRILYGYIGTFHDQEITTLKPLEPITDFKKGTLPLYDWFRELVKASCDKI